VNDSTFIGTHTEVLSLADYLAGSFSTASFVQGNVRRDLYRTDLAFFIQDQFKATDKLVLNYGLRHDYFGALSSTGPLSVWRPGQSGTDANGLLGVGNSGQAPTYKPGKLHFSPRVGFAYTASEKLVVRGSYGLYFDAAPFNGFGNNGSISTITASSTGLQTNPYAGVQNVSLNNATWQNNQYVWANAAGAASYTLFSVNPNLKMAYAHDFNLGTEYQLNRKTVITLGYTGSTGVHLYSLRDANQPGYWSTSSPGNTGGVTSTGTLVTATTATNACSLVANRANASCMLQRRPSFLNKSITNFANVSVVQEVASMENSNFHSLQASIKANGYKGMTMQFSYTYGHSLDNGSGFRSTGPSDSNNLAADYGPATFDIRHTLSGYVVYEVPQFTHRFTPLTKGWQGTASANIHSATPINLTFGDNTGIGMGKDRISYNGQPLKTGSRTIQTNPTTGVKYIQYWRATAATDGTLSNPTVPTRGNVGRDFFRGPNYYQIDAALVKNTDLVDNVKFQFRADLFNVFNIVNAGNPTTGITSAQFGQQTSAPTGISAGAPFNVQFAGKIIF
jgi:hypothetical protein